MKNIIRLLLLVFIPVLIFNALGSLKAWNKREYLKTSTNLCVVSFTYTYPNTILYSDGKNFETEKKNIYDAVTNSINILIPEIYNSLKELDIQIVDRKKLFIDDYYNGIPPLRDVFLRTFPVKGYRIIPARKKIVQELCESLEADIVLFLSLDFFLRPVFVSGYEDGTTSPVQILHFISTGIQIFFEGRAKNGKNLFRNKVIIDDDSIRSEEEYLKEGNIRNIYFSLHDYILTIFVKKLKKYFPESY